MQKKNFIDDVRVKDPCTQAWDEMVGNDKVRFCTHCAKDVNNLSAMTRKEAVRLVRKSGGSLCIRYVQQPETKAPMFAGQLTQITRRRVPLMAAGVMSASLSLATLTYAQGGAERISISKAPATAQVSECEDVPTAAKKTAERNVGNAAVRGKIQDPTGAVIPGAKVQLRTDDGSILMETAANEDGTYRMDSLASGNYKLTATSPGFREYFAELSIGDSGERVKNIALDVGAVSGMMVSTGPEFEGALAIAVSNEDVEKVKQLISRGENVNRKEEDGTTPIFVAVENGDLNMVQLLLDAGAKINARNKERETPIMRIDDDATPALVELLVRYGAKVNQLTKSGETALMRSARNAEPEVVKSLVDAGADLDVQNEEGMTALMFAADEDNVENARVLVLAGANVNLKDKDGESAWDKTGDADLEALLESYGAVTDEHTPEPEPQP
jgi:ankyrin repeat protein